MDMNILPFRTKILLESNLPKYRILVRRLAVVWGQGYIYIERERERHVYICVYIYIYTQIYVYIYYISIYLSIYLSLSLYIYIYVYIYIYIYEGASACSCLADFWDGIVPVGGLLTDEIGNPDPNQSPRKPV